MIKMQLKFAYFIKRFLIVTLLALVMVSISAITEQPVLYFLSSAVSLLLVRVLWVSAQKDEKRLARRRRRLQMRAVSRELPQPLRRAA